MPAHTPASALPSSLRVIRGSPSGKRYGLELNRARPRARRCRRRPPPRARERPASGPGTERCSSAPVPSSDCPSRVTSPMPTCPSMLERHALGHLDEQLADADVGFDLGRARREREIREIDGEVADAEVVRVLQLRRVEWPCDAVADSRPEAHGQGRRGREAGEQHEPEDDEASDTAAHRRPDRDRAADDRQGHGERHRQRDVVDVGHGEEPEETRGRQERAEHRQEERRSLGARRRRRRARRARRPGSVTAGSPASASATTCVSPLRSRFAICHQTSAAPTSAAPEPERALVRPEIGLGDERPSRRPRAARDRRAATAGRAARAAPRLRSSPRAISWGMTSHAAP